MKKSIGLRATLAAATIITATTTAAMATPQYALLTTIAIPADAANVQPGGSFTSFDISTYDPTSGYLYVGDRSNASIDVFNANNNTFVGSIPGFVGQTGVNATSGADGTAVIHNGALNLVLGGNGDSSVRAYTIPAVLPTTPAWISTYTTAYVANTNLPATSSTVDERADEMTYDPKDNLVLVANNAANPYPYTTIFNATTGVVVAQTVFDGGTGAGHAPLATNGVEASAYDPKSGNFFIAMPQFGSGGANDPGGIIVMSPSGAVVQSIMFSALGITSCTPSGLDISAGGLIDVGCSNGGTQNIVYNPVTGKIVATPAISGTDEVYYDAAINAFLVSGANNVGGPAFGIVDATTGLLSQTLATSPGNDHSIAGGAEIFVPFGGTADPTCPSGCLAVYAQVPEPGTLPILLTAMVGFIGLAVRRRFH